jgi:hypothetical protein
VAVVIDTSVWIPALERENSAEKKQVDELLADDAVVMVGLILVELLRGCRNEDDFTRFRQRLEPIPLLESGLATWSLAGRLLFELARRGQTIPMPDAIIAAHVLQGGHEILTTDEHFSRVPGLRLLDPRS